MLQNKHLLLWCMVSSGVTFFLSCSDIMVPDISDRKVVLVSPADSLVTNIQTHKFFWDTLGDATSYNIRIVTPSFDSVLAVVLDQTIEGNQIDMTLPFGDYEWRVVGVNDAYTSACCNVFRLFIRNDSSEDLTQQTILLFAPSDEACLNSSSMLLEWESLSNAGYYLLQAGNADFSTLVANETLTAPSYNLTLTTDGTYYWRVRAVNETSLTMTNWQKRSFTLDRVAPASPEVDFPDHGDTLQLSDQNPDLAWVSASDAVRDTVYIYNNAQRDILLLKIATDAGEINLDGTVIDQQGTIEDYFWEIISVDACGNISGSTDLHRFFVRQS